MFNIGIGELLIVLVVAFVIVGPDDLPKVARWLGRQVRRLRLLIRDIKAETGWNELEKEVRDVRQDIKTTVREMDITTDLRDAAKDVKHEFQDTAKGVEQDLRQIDQGVRREIHEVDTEVRMAVSQAEEARGTTKNTADAVKSETNAAVDAAYNPESRGNSNETGNH